METHSFTIDRSFFKVKDRDRNNLLFLRKAGYYGHDHKSYGDKCMRKPIKTMANLAVLAMMTSQAAHAGSFSLYTESSAAAMGNYGAGIAAEGADASIGWYNPAGLVLIKDQQVLLGGVGVFPSVQLTGSSTYTSLIPFPNIPPQSYVQSFSGLQGGENALVPSLHYALPLGERAAFGLSIVSPFGLSTNYSESSPVRYAATRSQFETVDVSPELGGKLTDHFSVGLGLDLEYARVKFNRMIGSPAFLQFAAVGLNEPVTPATLDSASNNSGDSFAVGFHAGAMYMFDNNHTRIGVNYQSAISHQFTGKSQLTGRLADPTLDLFTLATGNPNAQFTSNALYSNYIDLPQIVTLSGYQDINAKLAILGSVVYSGWSSFKTITLNNVAVGMANPSGDGTFIQTTLNSTTLEDYRNTWRFALGANYHVNQQWMMRVGGGYDQTPTVTAERDVRLPDSDRWALSIGAHYQMRPNLGFDAGYTYLFAANNAVVKNTQAIGATSTYNVNAIAKSNIQLVGLQVVWTIDQAKTSTK